MSAGRLLLRRGCLFVGGCGVSALLFAQSAAPNARTLAQRVDRHYNSLHSLKTGFSETYKGLGMDRTESGTMLLRKPGRMRWNYTSPAGKLFLLDGKYAWSYTRGDAQVQRLPAKDLSDLRSPLRYLLGHAELARELKHLTAAQAAGGQYTLTGVPTGTDNRITRVTLTVTADGIINEIAIQQIDGSLTSFTFTGQQPNAPIPPGTFHFTPPPGVPVVDALPPV
jgi:outer membrane lipoprotein carrier protein